MPEPASESLALLSWGSVSDTCQQTGVRWFLEGRYWGFTCASWLLRWVPGSLAGPRKARGWKSWDGGETGGRRREEQLEQS